MQVLQMTAISEADGKIRLTLPADANQEYQLAIVLSLKSDVKPKTPEELGWPPGFLESTYGSIDDEAFCRPPQPPFETR